MAAQILFWVPSNVCFYYFVSSLAAVPRAEAESRLKRPLPAEWEKVFIDHNVPYNWPHGRGFTALTGAGLLLSIVLMLVCEFILYRLHPKGGWMYRIAGLKSRPR